MSHRTHSDLSLAPIEPIVFRRTNSRPEPGRSPGNGGDDNRRPWEPWFFALLTALLVVFVVLMHSKSIGTP